MFGLHRSHPSEPLATTLFSQEDFYPAFLNDLRRAKGQVVIESPFITTRRMKGLMPILRHLVARGVWVVVNTKPTDEHEPHYVTQAQTAVAAMQDIGILVLFTVGHHRKVAIIDGRILWEGSLNILSQNDSCEVMRRICSEPLAEQMLDFLRLEEYLA